MLVGIGDVFLLGIDITSAIFQDKGHLCSVKLLFRVDVIEAMVTSAYSFSSQLGSRRARPPSEA